MLLSLRTSLLESLYKECIKQINSSSNHFTQTTLYISSEELFAHASFTSARGSIGPNMAGDSGVIGAEKWLFFFSGNSLLLWEGHSSM